MAKSPGKSPPRRPPRAPVATRADEPLNPQEQIFVDEFLIDFCATRAYRVAFPNSSRRAARVSACRMMQRPNVRAEIDAGRAELRRVARLSAQNTLREMARIASADLADCFDSEGNPRNVREIPINTRRALQSVHIRERNEIRGRGDRRRTVRETEHTYRLASKSAALEYLTNILGLRPKDSNPLEMFLAALSVNSPELAATIRLALAPAATRLTPANPQPEAQA